VKLQLLHSDSCLLISAIQAVVWTDFSSGLIHGADDEASWKAFSVPLELSESITAVDFAPVGIAAERYTRLQRFSYPEKCRGDVLVG